ncbi:uncharacterized protein LOC111320332 isoform X1 [Stylophora pistillata]|uniref:uncharacterized protein LOC111320332 isoform X1 n=1 Tax=Stylophora pistillata TaxID=50429 RepID=UPI000C04F6D5|nr:uncharacterized protein LOC111320332 isoform X1 [Stylophora pistillata]
MGKLFFLICLSVLILPGLFLRCHVCPPNERQYISACIAHSPQECKKYENACFFEYQGRMKNMGCGRDWHKPAGCHGTTCVKWCQSDLCNKELIRHSPFRKELGEDSAPDDSGNWFTDLFGGSSMLSAASVCCILTWFCAIIFP